MFHHESHFLLLLLDGNRRNNNIDGLFRDKGSISQWTLSLICESFQEPLKAFDITLECGVSIESLLVPFYLLPFFIQLFSVL